MHGARIGLAASLLGDPPARRPRTLPGIHEAFTTVSSENTHAGQSSPLCDRPLSTGGSCLTRLSEAHGLRKLARGSRRGDQQGSTRPETTCSSSGGNYTTANWQRGMAMLLQMHAGYVECLTPAPTSRANAMVATDFSSTDTTQPYNWCTRWSEMVRWEETPAPQHTPPTGNM